MIMPVTMYKTSSGKTFATEKDALDYELYEQIVENYTSEVHHRSIDAEEVVRYFMEYYELRPRAHPKNLPTPLTGSL